MNEDFHPFFYYSLCKGVFNAIFIDGSLPRLTFLILQ